MSFTRTSLVVVDSNTESQQEHSEQLSTFKKMRIATVGHDWVLDSLSAFRILPILDYLKHRATLRDLTSAGYNGEFVGEAATW